MDDPSGLRLPDDLLGRLRALYEQPQRHYHSMEHIAALLRGLAHHRALALAPDLIEAAIWFHDAVYDTRRADNEARSAALAQDELQARGWPPAATQRVSGLVLATRHHDASASDTDAWLFLDLDLSVLGQSADVYAAYATAVRLEHGWVEEAAWRAGRARVIKGLLARRQIYRTPALHADWEAAARVNLQGELDRLSATG